VVASLTGVIAITALYWAAQSQVWNVYPLWLRDRVDRGLFDLTVPVTWFQSLDTLAVLVLGPALIGLWRRQSARGTEPSDLGKIAMGCAAFVVGCLLLSASEIVSGGGKIGLVLPTLFHFMGAVGYLYVWPITFALVSRTAPAAANAMMLGACYLAIFVGGVCSGWLGRFYEVLPPAQFWLLHAAVAAVGVALILVLRGPLLRRLEQPM
jgi:POT family proton-dependent oligopeptide transporter